MTRSRPLSNDAQFMRQAVRLGRKALGRTSPNPPVGAVVVAGGRVVGRGYHHGPGHPHGEIEALRAAGERSRGATLYVTLEPCNHHGRTPPCTAAILAAGVRRVVFGMHDPNPRVRGGGAARLRRRGVAVVAEVEAEACAELNAGFASLVTRGRPLVTLKLAASLDGRIATRTGASRWITGPPARAVVHRLRDEHDAVLVGAGTVIADDPRLTCRRRGGRDPLRVVLDGRLRTPLDAGVVSGAAAGGTLVVTAARGGRNLAELRRRGVRLLTLPARRGLIDVRLLLRRLASQGIASLLVEGGAGVAAQMLAAGVVDRALFFFAPKLIGGDGLPMLGPLGVADLDRAPALRIVRVSTVGRDVLVQAVRAARR